MRIEIARRTEATRGESPMASAPVLGVTAPRNVTGARDWRAAGRRDSRCLRCGDR